MRKFHRENVNEEEHKQLTNSIDKLEASNVERLKCLVEIAEIRKQGLRDVMQKLNLVVVGKYPSNM